MTLFFPITMIVLSLGAAVMYAVAGDWVRALYWVAAAILTLTVTLL